MTLREVFEMARDNVPALWRIDHDIGPLWHAVTENGEHFLVATPWRNNDEKDMAVAGLRDLFKRKHVVAYVFICEAWVAEYNEEQVRKGPLLPASLHPDRREVVRIVAEDDKHTLHGCYYILRPEHGEPVLSPFHDDSDGSGDFGGRMTGLLREETDG